MTASAPFINGPIKRLISSALPGTSLVFGTVSLAAPAHALSDRLEAFIGAEPPLFATADEGIAAFKAAMATGDLVQNKGPVVDYRNFFSTRGALAYPLVPSEQAGAAAFGISYQVAAFAPATGWSNTPAGDDAVSPPRQSALTVATSFAAQNPTRIYDVYIYDSVVDGVSAYDRALMTSSGVAKDATQAAANLAVGDWADVRLVGADGLIGARAGQTAGFYVKLINLSGSAGTVGEFKLYFTSVARG